MKFLRSLLAVFYTTTAAAESSPKKEDKPPAEVMRELRLQWLTRRAPADSAVPIGKEVTAVLMDWPLEKQTITILASAVGDASIYTTSTFGIMGGIGHENARNAALAFVECAKKHLVLALPTTDFSYPDSQHVRFFFVTSLGVRSVTFSVVETEKTDSVAQDLYSHGQAVLTEMRLITQKQRGY